MKLKRYLDKIFYPGFDVILELILHPKKNTAKTVSSVGNLLNFYFRFMLTPLALTIILTTILYLAGVSPGTFISWSSTGIHIRNLQLIPTFGLSSSASSLTWLAQAIVLLIVYAVVVYPIFLILAAGICQLFGMYIASKFRMPFAFRSPFTNTLTAFVYGSVPFLIFVWLYLIPIIGVIIQDILLIVSAIVLIYAIANQQKISKKAALGVLFFTTLVVALIAVIFLAVISSIFGVSASGNYPSKSQSIQTNSTSSTKSGTTLPTSGNYSSKIQPTQSNSTSAPLGKPNQTGNSQPNLIEAIQQPAFYDEQLALVFANSSSQSLCYNVTAVAQSDAQGIGPAYLISGVSNKGYWYQVGLYYNWPAYNGSVYNGFRFGYAYNYNNISGSQNTSATYVYLENFSGRVNPGDKVLLQLHFNGSNVVASAVDWDTNASAVEYLNGKEATKFLGTPLEGTNAFFTGLMTEWKHTQPYYGTESEVGYQPYCNKPPDGVLHIEEYVNNTKNSLFAQSAQFISSHDSTSSLSINNAAESYNYGYFVTGT